MPDIRCVYFFRRIFLFYMTKTLCAMIRTDVSGYLLLRNMHIRCGKLVLAILSNPMYTMTE